MSAETAWKVACSTVAISVEEWQPEAEGTSQDALNAVADAIRSLPMPPAFEAAFRAAVEVEVIERIAQYICGCDEFCRQSAHADECRAEARDVVVRLAAVEADMGEVVEVLRRVTNALGWHLDPEGLPSLSSQRRAAYEEARALLFRMEGKP